MLRGERGRRLSLAEVATLCAGSNRHAAVLRTITVGELCSAAKQPSLPPPKLSDEALVLAIQQMFEASPDTWFASSDVRRRFGIPRWTALKHLGALVKRNALEKRGKKSGTRYRLAPRSEPR